MKPEVTKTGAENLLYQLAKEQQEKIAPPSPQNFDSSILDLDAIDGVYQFVTPSARLIRVLSRIKQDAFRALRRQPIKVDTYHGTRGLVLGGAFEAMADQEMINRKILSQSEDESDRDLMFVPGPASLRFWEFLHGANKRVDGRFGLYHIMDSRKQAFRYSSDAIETNQKGEVIHLVEYSTDDSPEYIGHKLDVFEAVKSKFGEILHKATLKFVFLSRAYSEVDLSYPSLAVQKATDEAYRTHYSMGDLQNFVNRFLMPPRPARLVRVENTNYNQPRGKHRFR